MYKWKLFFLYFWQKQAIFVFVSWKNNWNWDFLDIATLKYYFLPDCNEAMFPRNYIPFKASMYWSHFSLFRIRINLLWLLFSRSVNYVFFWNLCSFLGVCFHVNLFMLHTVFFVGDHRTLFLTCISSDMAFCVCTRYMQRKLMNTRERCSLLTRLICCH